MIPWEIYKNWGVQNENWEKYLLSNNILMHSCLHNLPLKLFSKLFYVTKAPIVYVL